MGLARADDPGHQQAGAGGDLPPGSPARGHRGFGDIPDPSQNLGVVGNGISVARGHAGGQGVERGEGLGLVGRRGDRRRADAAGRQDPGHPLQDTLAEQLRFAGTGAHHSSSA
ncbi:hypothetical protein [Streptomyces sp. NPDC014733]|uniref:hypothetical protein n=1 Tax=Streptomyces sp. NPDC014733 TaxID=3364885 RepID=UPI0036FC6680